jgi:hypothetical protein
VKQDGGYFAWLHPYVYLGSIFTASNLRAQNKQIPAAFVSPHKSGGIDNLTAYNIGASVIPDFA